METRHIHTQLDDAVIRVDGDEEIFRCSVSGTWQTDGQSPLFSILSEYVGRAPTVILDLSTLEYQWWDGFLRMLVTDFWRSASELIIITPPEHPRWVDMLIWVYYRSTIPTGATSGTLSIQCGSYTWQHGTTLDPNFSAFLRKLCHLDSNDTS